MVATDTEFYFKYAATVQLHLYRYRLYKNINHNIHISTLIIIYILAE